MYLECTQTKTHYILIHSAQDFFYKKGIIMIHNKQSTNTSIKNILRIARKYSYKTKINVVSRIGKGIAYISIWDNFLKSPYPRHMCSKSASLKYVEKMYNKEK